MNPWNSYPAETECQKLIFAKTLVFLKSLDDLRDKPEIHLIRPCPKLAAILTVLSTNPPVADPLRAINRTRA